MRAQLMPTQLTSGDRKILLMAAGVFVALLGLSALMIRGRSSDEDIPTVYSTGSGGCRAAFLLLRESGYRAETWERPLADLPAGRGITLILPDPATFPISAEKEKLSVFLRSGGRLIATGRFAGFYLPFNEERFAPVPAELWRPIPALSPSPITRAAPQITFAPQLYWGHAGKTVALYGDNKGAAVVEFKIGEGSVLWMSEATPLTNAGLKEKGNLEFFLAAIGEPGTARILWDEYVHGYERSRARGRNHPVIGWIALQLGLFAAAILITYSRRNEAVWTPALERRLSPLEFVRTLGSLYEHANAGVVAVEICYQRFRYLLTHRLGLSTNSSIHDLDRTLRERGNGIDSRFADTLTACESCRYDSQISPSAALRLVQALFDYAVRLKLIRSDKNQRGKNAWKQS
jgi:hypothetical protein